MSRARDREIVEFNRLRDAAILAVADGRVLHFDAPAVPVSRSNPAGNRALVGTAGRVVKATGGEAFAIFTYGNERVVRDRNSVTGRKVVGRIDEEHPTAEHAVRALCIYLGEERRVPVLRAALRKAFADEIAEHEEVTAVETSLRVTEMERAHEGRRRLVRFGLA